jgi:N-acetylmuramoyl-L-alanine amidase
MVTFTKPARPVSRIFIHCTAYGRGDLFGKQLLDAVNSWHVARGWDKIGYHYLIDRNGLLIPTYRSLEEKPIAQANNNTGTIAISLDGLIKTDFNAKQFATLRNLADLIDAVYKNIVHYHGHCEVANKACPVFDYKAVLGLDAHGYRNHTGNSSATAEVLTPAAVPETKNPISRRVLQKTLSGVDVAWVQRRLGVKDDGDFGHFTDDAVRAYQKKNGLRVDGIVGKNTWDCLIRDFTSNA